MKGKTPLSTISIILVGFLMPSPAHAVIHYVKEGGTGDGSSWATPYGDLQQALAASSAFDQIWVASGTYKPGTDPFDIFQLVNEVVTLGGFTGTPGTEGDPNARDPDPATNGTVLSGDIAPAGNSFVIVEADGLNNSTILDGFTISGATKQAIHCLNIGSPQFNNLLIQDNQATFAGFGLGLGAGIFNELNASPKVTNCVFLRNDALGWGGAIYNEFGSHPQITDCRFEDNTSAGDGGGAIFNQVQSYPTIEDCQFINNVSSNANPGGGAISHTGGADPVRRLIVRNCLFQGNQALGTLSPSGKGGAIAQGVDLLPPWIVNCRFENNIAEVSGGALFISNAIVVNCAFSGNIGQQDAGAIHGQTPDQQSLIITNCSFTGNVADDLNSGLGRGGAVFHDGSFSNLTITNCTISSNEAKTAGGGGLYTTGFDPGGTVTGQVINSIVWNNKAASNLTEDAQIFDVNPGMFLTVTNSCVYLLGRFSDEVNGNIGLNPLFVNELGSDGTAGTGDEDLALQPASPCIDSGTNPAVPPDRTDVDEDGNVTEDTPDLVLAPRILKLSAGDVFGNCALILVDMGALEHTQDCDGNGILDFQDIAACDGDPGCTDIDVNDDGILDQCQDCNGNGTPDPVEIANQTSSDCNGNCVPDECDVDCDSDSIPDDCSTVQGTVPDCNQNGIPDSCDIFDLTSEDCNSSGVPDECEFFRPMDNRATEFIMTFPPGFESPPPSQGVTKIELHLASELNTTVTVVYPIGSTNPADSQTVSLTPGNVVVISLDRMAAYAWQPGVVLANAVHAFSDDEFSCYMVHRYDASSDAALALPANVMATEFIALAHPKSQIPNSPDKSQFVVVAREDNTTVTVLPKVDLIAPQGVFPANVSFNVQLDRGQGILMQNDNDQPGMNDVTGSIITADKPIGLTNGNLCANVPTNTTFCDQMFEVAQPVSAWGNEVFIVNLPLRSNGSLYRVLAAEDNTTVTRDGEVWGTINRGEILEEIIRGSHVIASDNSQKPIFVAQYMPSAGFQPGAPNGDPAMVNLVPISQFLSQNTFSTVVTLPGDPNGNPQFQQNFVTVIAKRIEVILDQVILDGNPIDQAEFIPFAGSDYCFARLVLLEGTHTSSSVSGHGITVEGYNNHDSYAYPGGAILGIEPVIARIFVDAASTAVSPTGQDWLNAYPKLKDALSNAVTTAACQSVEIRVAAGTYMPDGGFINDAGFVQGSGTRTDTFQLFNNVRIRGGYMGTSENEEPNPKDNVTILSGDRLNDDGTIGNDENSYHVVTGSGTNASAVLEGFTITAGNADGTNQNNDFGGGMYNNGGSPTVTQCVFVGNTASGSAARGGGVSNINGSSPTFTNCMFTGNTTASAGSGGGMSNMVSSPTLINCTFSGNVAGYRGGGISNEVSSNPTVTNCILWGNDQGDSAGTRVSAQINDWGGIEGSASDVSHSCVEGTWPGTGDLNIACDPLFVDPDGLDNILGTADDNLRISDGSPCIDLGNSCDVPANIQTDLDGNSRFVVGVNTGVCLPEPGLLECNLQPLVDMGAFEFVPSAALVLHGSEKGHGSAGSFLIESGNVECRDIQGDLTLVYVFDKPVYSDDGDAFVAGDFALINGAFVSVVQSTDLKKLTIICNNVLDARCFGIAFTVENVAGVEASFDHAWPILRGDADGDGLVDDDDTTEVNNQNGIPIDAGNYRCDIDYDGLIEGDSASPVGDDWAIANTAQGNGLLPCWPVSDSISSRKSHGIRDYDIPSGGIEPRTGNLLIVFEFDRLVRSLDDDPLAPPDFTVSSGTVAWVSAGWDWSTVEVTILGASDKETFTISFDAEDKDNFPIYTEGCWSMLVGDVDGDGSTSSVDTAAIAGANRAPITSSNFKYDIDANGQITGAAPDTTDHDLANANTGQSVTTCP